MNGKHYEHYGSIVTKVSGTTTFHDFLMPHTLFLGRNERPNLIFKGYTLGIDACLTFGPLKKHIFHTVNLHANFT